MGKKKAMAMGRFDALVKELGPENLMEKVTADVVEGMNPMQIAGELGVSYLAMKKWIEMDDKRCEAMGLAFRVLAEKLVFESIDITNRALEDSEMDVNAARLAAGHYLKIAALWDKRQYGDEKDVGGGGISVFVNREGVLLKHNGSKLEIVTEETKEDDNKVNKAIDITPE